MRLAVFSKRRRSLKLFSDFNTLQFASIMAIVMFVLLLAFMTEARPFHGISGDLPKVIHPVPMPGANREDAIKIWILRDGQVHLGSDGISSADISEKIKDRLKDPEVEHKVYIIADARARWGTVKLVLQAARDAGIIRVTFLADQRTLTETSSSVSSAGH